MLKKDRRSREKYLHLTSTGSRSAQGGMNAAILVAIIAGLIILYIIFLPTAEREKLIIEGKDKTATAEEGSNLLLKVNPGLLSTTSGLEDEKSIPNAFLVETTNAKELEKINPFIVRNGVFDKREKKIEFQLDDPDNIDNVVLSFTAKKRKGILAIKLNGASIFENELTSEITEPVKLGKSLLDKSNTLEFSISSVGWQFWSTNEYSIENAKIIGDITDTSKQQSTNIFTITQNEFSSMERGTLKFIPYCSNVNELGTLDIFVNNKKLFSAVPVCDNSYKQSIPKTVLNEGENNIVFKTNKGSYSVEQVRIALEFKEPAIKTYYFEVSKDNFDSIISGGKDAELAIKFVDDGKEKMAKLDVNGKPETVQTKKNLFTKIINSKISEGNNYVRLEPFEDLEIVELKIEIV